MPSILHARAALLPDGWAEEVRVEIGDDGRIARVAPGSPPRSDAGLAGVLLPALANLHSHAFQRAMAGLTELRSGPEGDDFWSWRVLMYRFLDRLAPEDVEAIAAQAYTEMLEGGFAAVAEFHYLHHAPGGVPYDDPAEMAGRIAAASAATGIGLRLLPVLYMRGGMDGRAPEGGQLRFACDRDRFGTLLEATRRHGEPGVAPHSLRAVAPGDIAWAAGLMPEAPLHIHAAEQTAEVEEVVAALGRRPVETLLDLGVDARWCLIHATHMTGGETRALAASGAVAGLCPVTESNLGDGIFPAAAHREAGGRFGVGTDSNILIDAGTELRTLETSQRLALRRRAVLAGPGSVGETLWQAACAGGAQAAGRNSGAIEAGRLADLVTLGDAPGAEALPAARRLDHALFACARLPVDRLWSAGRLVVEDGQAPGREAVRRRFETVMARLGGAI